MPKYQAPVGTATHEKRISDGDKHTDWVPYCLRCSTMARMAEEPYGFRCDETFTESPLIIGSLVLPGRTGCGNKINWDLTHYELGDIPTVKPTESRQVRRARERKWR